MSPKTSSYNKFPPAKQYQSRPWVAFSRIPSAGRIIHCKIQWGDLDHVDFLKRYYVPNIQSSSHHAKG